MEIRKKIKNSKRGLTFSLSENSIKIGTHYRYVVDKVRHQILIIPDENGQLMYEISDDGYSATYRKNNGTGTMIIMPNEEKEALLKRIDNRKAEKKDLEMLKQMKPQQIDFFKVVK